MFAAVSARFPKPNTVSGDASSSLASGSSLHRVAHPGSSPGYRATVDAENRERGGWFDSIRYFPVEYRTGFARIAQMERALSSEDRGRRFEPCYAHQSLAGLV